VQGQARARGADQGAVGVGMIKVSVGIEHVFERQIVSLELGQNLLGVAAGIDDGGLPGFFTAHHVAVGLYQANGQGDKYQ